MIIGRWHNNCTFSRLTLAILVLFFGKDILSFGIPQGSSAFIIVVNAIGCFSLLLENNYCETADWGSSAFIVVVEVMECWVLIWLSKMNSVTIFEWGSSISIIVWLMDIEVFSSMFGFSWAVDVDSRFLNLFILSFLYFCSKMHFKWETC